MTAPATRKHLKVAAACTGFVMLMVGAAFAAVPLYDMFCRVTGFGGTTQRAEAGSGEILDRTIVVRFDSNVSGDLPWEFRPKETRMELKIGETAEMVYLAENTGDTATSGTSTYNVSPPQAGYFFNKIQCFCFTEQRIEPGETVEMPVQFFVDPAIVDDKDARGIHEITLSYTFYPDRGAKAEEPVAAAPDTRDRQPM